MQKMFDKNEFEEHIEEDTEVIDDEFDEENPWEHAFQRGVDLADNEMIEGWNTEDV